MKAPYMLAAYIVTKGYKHPSSLRRLDGFDVRLAVHESFIGARTRAQLSIILHADGAPFIPRDPDARSVGVHRARWRVKLLSEPL